MRKSSELTGMTRLFRQCCMVLGVFLFNTSFSQAQNVEVKLFGHRGGAYEYDENTMEALQKTYDLGLRGYEIDIRKTKDDRLVLFHDANLKRIVGQEGAIEELTLEEVRRLKTKKGNPIPTLEEVLAFFSDKPGVYIEFEMKTNNPMYDDPTVEQYCDQLYRKVYEAIPPNSEYLLTSFDKRPLRYLKTNYPSVDLLFIKPEGISQGVLDEAKELGIDRIGCNLDGTTRAMVKEAQKQGFKVSLWPGRTVEDFLLGLTLGSDYLCSDVPMEVRNWVKENASWISLK